MSAKWIGRDANEDDSVYDDELKVRRLDEDPDEELEEEGPKKKSRVWLWTTLVVVLGLVGWVWFEIAKGLPTLDQLENPHPEMATRIISSDGEPIDQYFIKNRTTVRLKEIPQHLIDALIATEDRDFYDHWGFDTKRFLQAVWIDVVTLSPRQGASTITQQLARNLYFTQEKTIMRKLREAISAVQIEKTHTKKEIIQMYLNTVYLGRGAYGIQVASQLYFNKDAKDLNLAESAYMVGILKGPENYDPEENYDRAISRRNLVLNEMLEADFIDAATAESAKRSPIKTVPLKGYQGIAPHFVEMIRLELSKKPELQGYDLYRDGLVVYTTLNAEMQRAANRAVEEHIEHYQKNVVSKRWNWANHRGLLDTIVSKAIRSHPEYRTANDDTEKRGVAAKLRKNEKFIDSVKNAEIRMQTGFVCLDHTTGGITAMVGSSNFKSARYGLNHTTQIARQPGSAFKPIIYASAFEQGATPETLVSNEPINMPDGDRVWSPGNFEGESVGGMVTIKSALQHSINLAAIHTMLEKTSIQDVIRTAKRMGIKSPVGAYPSLALGVSEVNPLELTAAYAVFANEGIRAEPYAIVQVEDRQGKVLYRAKPQFEHVFDPRIARMMTSCLASVVDAGTAIRIRSMFSYPAAGKTGTTQNFADAWFVGYTPHFTAGVWVGFDDKRIQFVGADGQGGRAAAPIWGKFMKYAYEAVKPKVTYFLTNWQSMPGEGGVRRLPQPNEGELPPIPDVGTPYRNDYRIPTLDKPKPQPARPMPTDEEIINSGEYNAPYGIVKKPKKQKAPKDKDIEKPQEDAGSDEPTSNNTTPTPTPPASTPKPPVPPAADREPQRSPDPVRKYLDGGGSNSPSPPANAEEKKEQ